MTSDLFTSIVNYFTANDKVSYPSLKDRQWMAELLELRQTQVVSIVKLALISGHNVGRYGLLKWFVCEAVRKGIISEIHIPAQALSDVQNWLLDDIHYFEAQVA